uniref:Uncharacterized protein n=1 Tax=Glossina pallidipes TaxID=7398 RepID=A0A1B0AIB6_GLOPL
MTLLRSVYRYQAICHAQINRRSLLIKKQAGCYFRFHMNLLINRPSSYTIFDYDDRLGQVYTNFMQNPADSFIATIHIYRAIDTTVHRSKGQINALVSERQKMIFKKEKIVNTF